MKLQNSGLWPLFQKKVIETALENSLIKQDIVKMIRMPAGTTATTLLGASKVSIGGIDLAVFHLIDADGNKFACFTSSEELQSLSDTCLTILKSMEFQETSGCSRIKN